MYHVLPALPAGPQIGFFFELVGGHWSSEPIDEWGTRVQSEPVQGRLFDDAT